MSMSIARWRQLNVVLAGGGLRRQSVEEAIHTNSPLDAFFDASYKPRVLRVRKVAISAVPMTGHEQPSGNVDWLSHQAENADPRDCASGHHILGGRCSTGPAFCPARATNPSSHMTLRRSPLTTARSRTIAATLNRQASWLRGQPICSQQ